MISVFAMDLLSGGEVFDAIFFWVKDIFDSGRDSPSDYVHRYEPTAGAPMLKESPAELVRFEPPEFERQSYYPMKDCAASRLYIGDRAYVSWIGGSNGIRSEPDTHPSDNIIYRAPPGEGMKIIGGTECNYGWILWEVVTDTGQRGWTPESDGKDMWLVPVESQDDVIADLQGNPSAREAYERVSATMRDPYLSEAEKRDQIRIHQGTYGEEVVAWVVRMVPVYQGDGSFVSFDQWARDFSSTYGSTSGKAPIDRDPVGASLSIFFDPSVENITEQLGLEGWMP